MNMLGSRRSPTILFILNLPITNLNIEKNKYFSFHIHGVNVPTSQTDFSIY